MYSTKSKLAEEVCEKVGITFKINFVSAMKRNGIVYVKGTCGKQSEFDYLRKECEKNGYKYVGR